MLILSLNFWRRAEGTCFVSRSGVLIFHSTVIKKKKDITEFSNVSCDSIYKYFVDKHYISFNNGRSLGGTFPFILVETFSTLVLLQLQHVCSQRNRFYTFLKCSYFHIFCFFHTFSFMSSQINCFYIFFMLFQPSYFPAFLPFQLIKYSTFFLFSFHHAAGDISHPIS